MSRIEIYTKNYCPFCHRAKALLDSKGVSYKEIEISLDEARQLEMRTRSGRRTVPQVFIDNRHIGGSDDLDAANRNGLLDELIGLRKVSAG